MALANCIICICLQFSVNEHAISVNHVAPREVVGGSVRFCVRAQSVWACILMGLVGFVLELNKERFKGLEYGFSVALLTVPIVAIPGAGSMYILP